MSVVPFSYCMLHYLHEEYTFIDVGSALGILPLGRIELLGKPELQYEVDDSVFKSVHQNF